MRGLLIILALSLGCAATRDPIDHLISSLGPEVPFKLSRSQLVAQLIDLPPKASPESVISKVFQTTFFEQKQVAAYKILEVRSVHIQGRGEAYTAALVQTDCGQKIVLITYFFEQTGWWAPTRGWLSRVYDAKP